MNATTKTDRPFRASKNVRLKDTRGRLHDYVITWDGTRDDVGWFVVGDDKEAGELLCRMLMDYFNNKHDPEPEPPKPGPLFIPARMARNGIVLY